VSGRRLVLEPQLLDGGPELRQRDLQPLEGRRAEHLVAIERVGDEVARLQNA